MTEAWVAGGRARRPHTFTLTLVLVLAAAAVVSVVLAPPLASGVNRLGLHFPFARVFDRVAIASLAIALLWQRRRLKLGARLARGFARPQRNLPGAIRGLAVGILGMAILWMLATLKSPRGTTDCRGLLTHASSALATGLAVGVIEEGFFRAFLLDGLEEDFGAGPALIGSAVVYAVAHLVRVRARHQATRLEMGAGARNLGSGLRGLAAKRSVPGFIGLFLLGLVLGRAFQRTRTAYFSTGFHAGLVCGVKLWRYAPAAHAGAAGWVSGYGWPPLVSGAGAWVMLAVVVLLVGPLTGTRREPQC